MKIYPFNKLYCHFASVAMIQHWWGSIRRCGFRRQKRFRFARNVQDFKMNTIKWKLHELRAIWTWNETCDYKLESFSNLKIARTTEYNYHNLWLTLIIKFDKFDNFVLSVCFFVCIVVYILIHRSGSIKSCS
jgi:hypothetical protein